MKFSIRKEEGNIIIEDLDLDLAIHLRRKMEHDFDAQVVLEVCHEDRTKLIIRGVTGVSLGDDATAQGYRMWLGGWWAGYNDTEVGLGKGD